MWLPELGDRFFKLTLQLFNRYAAWINTGLGLTSGVASSSGVSVKMLISSYLSSLSSSSSASPAVWSSLTGTMLFSENVLSHTHDCVEQGHG